MSGKPLNMKDLFPLEFKLLEDKESGEKKALIAKSERYVCAISNDILGNSVPCTYLKTRLDFFNSYKNLRRILF